MASASTWRAATSESGQHRLHIHATALGHLQTETAVLRGLWQKAKDQHRHQPFIHRIEGILRLGRLIQDGMTRVERSDRQLGKLLEKLRLALVNAAEITMQIIQLHHFLPLQVALLAIYSRLFAVVSHIQSVIGDEKPQRKVDSVETKLVPSIPLDSAIVPEAGDIGEVIQRKQPTVSKPPAHSSKGSAPTASQTPRAKTPGPVDLESSALRGHSPMPPAARVDDAGPSKPRNKSDKGSARMADTSTPVVKSSESRGIIVQKERSVDGERQTAAPAGDSKSDASGLQKHEAPLLKASSPADSARKIGDATMPAAMKKPKRPKSSLEAPEPPAKKKKKKRDAVDDIFAGF